MPGPMPQRPEPGIQFSGYRNAVEAAKAAEPIDKLEAAVDNITRGIANHSGNLQLDDDLAKVVMALTEATGFIIAQRRIIAALTKSAIHTS